MTTHTEPEHYDPNMDINDWPGSPLSTIHPDEPITHTINTEKYRKDDRYVVRFELPGVDPARDLEVTVDSQILKVRAERYDVVQKKEGSSSFRYGLFSVNVPLPADIDDTDVTATCQNGVLQVTVGFVDKTKHYGHKVPVKIIPPTA